MKTRPVALLLGALSLGLTACSPPAATSDNVNAEALGAGHVATVNGERVPESLLRVYALASERKNLDELDVSQQERLVDDLIGVELLNQQAEIEGLAGSRTLAAQIELQRLQLIGRAMATDYLQKNPPTETELQEIYDENLPRLAGQQFKARHILVETKEEAESVIAELEAGAEFASLAAARADGPTGPNGGALDWFTLDSIPEPFADAVQAMTVGSYTPTPVQTDFGFHVILLEDQRQQEAPALADIRGDLVAAAERKKLENYIRGLREAADVVVER